ncbi:hypothetical protein HID58_074979 [Brassica napus]|uniref:Uncharacterized protein n=1 Tax=Brassica napus TaxID=3708 RepID=A0ABQ7YK05_BRANA|nr:hypothetical protein HID58_074979 [Brassica napus]
MFPELSDQDRRSAMVYVSHADETERNARIQRVRHAIEDSAKTPPSTSSAPLVPLESEGETESSSASLPVVLPPFDITTGFPLGTSSMDPTACDFKGGKKARRRPPSWKRKTQGRVAATASNSAQKGVIYRENGTKRNLYWNLMIVVGVVSTSIRGWWGMLVLRMQFDEVGMEALVTIRLSWTTYRVVEKSSHGGRDPQSLILKLSFKG